MHTHPSPAAGTPRPDEIAELLGMIDEFLRTHPGAIEDLAEYFATRSGATGSPEPYCDPDYQRARARSEANLFLDRVSFAAHALRTHRTEGGRTR